MGNPRAISWLRPSLAQVTLLSLLAGLLSVVAPSVTLPPAKAAAVDTSTEGYQFDISLAPSRSSGTQWNLFLSSSSSGSATIKWPSSAQQTYTLTAGQIRAIVVPEADRMAIGATGVQAKNTSITSNVAISVYACWIQSAASDCTNYYPTPTWGTKYRTLYTPASVGTQIVNIVTGSSAATVTLTSPRAVTGTPISLAANTPTNITIPANRSYQLASSSGDFTGLLITSNVPVSVLNGAECVNFNSLFAVTGACDMASQSVPPVGAWGTNFYTVNYRNYGTTGSGYRILADQNNTVVTVSGDTTGLVSYPTNTALTRTLNAGEAWTFKAYSTSSAATDPHKSLSITSNNPVLVGHYMFNGGNSTAYRGITGTTPTTGDPSMSYVTPFEQFLNGYTFASPSGLPIANLNVVAPATAVGSIKLDGVTIPANEFRQIAGSTWRSAQLAISTGTHSISAPQAFGIEAYGAGSYDSYAYTGGANTSPLANVAALNLTASSINGVVGQQACIPVQVRDANNAPVLGIRVDASISGASGTKATNAISDSKGIANICYTGTAAGSDSVTFTANGFAATASVTWSVTLPVISYSPSTIVLGAGTAMPALTPTNTGGLATSWAINPPLTTPSGLTFNTSTGVITGTPAVGSATTYSITAENSAGTSVATSLTLSAATPAKPASITFSPNPWNITLDSAAQISPTVTGGTFTTWSVSPALPSGLSINAQNGTISGTPDRVSASASYTVTATNTNGSTTASLSIAVAATAPNISFSPTSFTAYKDVAITAIAPSNSGSPATSWSISPALPAGLAFNSTNGNITGTPSGSSASTNYTITATNSAGNSSATISIQVLNNVTAPSIAISPSSVTLQQNQDMTAIVPTNTGGTASSWTISPALPAGLSFTSSTGRISGKPTSTLSATTYTITATNSGGSSQATVSLTISGNNTGNKYTFNANTGSGTGPADLVLLSSNGTLTAPVNTFNAPAGGWTFADWCPTAVAKGAACPGGGYAANANLPQPSAPTETLYARWISLSYSVTYVVSDASTGSAPVESNLIAPGASYTVKAGTGFTRTGFSFGGWYLFPSFTGTAYGPGYTTTYTMGNGNVTFYAKWSIGAYSVTYNANGGSGTVPTDSRIYRYQETATALGNTGPLTREGYTFAGWTLNENGTGTVYNSGVPHVMSDSSITFYAKWTPKQYVITYNTNGANGLPERGGSSLSSETYIVGTSAITLPSQGTLARTGYNFGGWSTTPTGTAISGSTFTPTQRTTLYALWTRKSSTITFNLGTAGGVAITSDDVPTPSPITGSYRESKTLPVLETVTAAICRQQLGTPASATISVVGSDCLITFSADTTWTTPSNATNYRILLVGGGAAGRADGGGGGGGGGGLETSTVVIAPGTVVTVDVGAGGTSSLAAGSPTRIDLDGTPNTFEAEALGGSASPNEVWYRPYGLTDSPFGSNFTTGIRIEVSVTSGAIYFDDVSGATPITVNGGSGIPVSSSASALQADFYVASRDEANAFIRKLWVKYASPTGTASTLNIKAAPADTATVSSFRYSTATDRWYEAVTATLNHALAKTAASNRTLYTLSGYLAQIESASENEVATTLTAGRTPDFWIDGSDSASEGVWKFSDNRIFFGTGAIAGSYTNWNSGEPNNDTNGNARPDGEDCAELYAGDGKWNDVYCLDTDNDYLVEYGTYAHSPYSESITVTIPSAPREGGVGGAPTAPTGWTASAGGTGGNGPTNAIPNQSAASAGGAGFLSSITGADVRYGGGGGGGISSHENGVGQVVIESSPGGTGGGGAGATQTLAESSTVTWNYTGVPGSPSQTLIPYCIGNNTYYKSTTGFDGLNGYGGGGGGGAAFGDGCQGSPDSLSDGERTAGGSGGSGVVIVRFTPTVTNRDFAFAGWSDGSETFGSGSSYRMPESNGTLTAQWALPMQVRYVLNGGSLPADRSSYVNINGVTGTYYDSECDSSNSYVCASTAITLNGDVTKSGYTFAGWKVGPSGGEIVQPGAFTLVSGGGTEKYIFTAQWTPTAQSVTYVPNLGSPTPTQTAVETYETFTVAAAITRTGYIFNGWIDGLNRVYGPGAEYVVETQTVTLTAQWVSDVFTVNFDWNGGTGPSTPSQDYTVGVSSAIPLPGVGSHVKIDHEFAGWVATPSGTSLISSPFTPTGNTTLYAKWSPGPVTITYNYNYLNGPVTPISKARDVEFTLLEPTRGGYVFLGWYDLAALGTRQGTDNFTKFVATAATTFYAYWAQASLYGIPETETVKVLTINASTSLTQTSSIADPISGATFKIEVPAGALPQDTKVDVYLIRGGLTRAQNKLGSFYSAFLSAIVAWKAPDESIPDTPADKKLKVTISSIDILKGAVIYQIVNGVSTQVGTAIVDGEIVALLQTDPEVVVAATVPGAPRSAAAENGQDEKTTITWEAPLTDGGTPITKYVVQAVGNPSIGCETTGATACGITNLVNNTPYTFTIKAENRIGFSAVATTNTITPVPPPGQVVTWNPDVTLIYLGQSPFRARPLATSDSDGEITYEVLSAGTTGCTVESGIANISFTAAGTCTIRVNAARSPNRGPGSTTVIFTISPVDRTITINDNSYQRSYIRTQTGPTLTTTVSNGVGTISYNSANTAICTVNSNGAVSFLSSGRCTITATIQAAGIYATVTSPAINIELSNPPVAEGGGIGAPKVTALYFKAMDPEDENKVSSKQLCISVFSRDLSPRFLASGCSDDQGNVNLLAADAKVTIKVYEVGYGDKTNDYTGVIGSDIFLMDGTSFFPGTTRWRVSAPKAGSQSTTPKPTPTPTPTPTPKPEPTPTNEKDLDPVTSGSNLKPGSNQVLINGKSTNATVTANPNGDGFIIKGSDWQIDVILLNAESAVKPVTEKGYIDGELPARLRITAKGLKASDDIRIYLFANLILLQTGKTNSSGEFTTTFEIPEAIKPGNHSLQVNAYLPSKDVVSASLGLVLSPKQVAPTPTPTPTVSPKPTPAPTKAPVKPAAKKELVISFSFGKFTVSTKQQAAIKQLDLKGKNVQVSLVGYAQNNGTRDDLRISLDRALEVRKAILKIAPKAKVTVFGGGAKVAKKCVPFKNRCVIASVTKG